MQFNAKRMRHEAGYDLCLLSLAAEGGAEGPPFPQEAPSAEAAATCKPQAQAGPE